MLVLSRGPRVCSVILVYVSEHHEGIYMPPKDSRVDWWFEYYSYKVSENEYVISMHLQGSPLLKKWTWAFIFILEPKVIVLSKFLPLSRNFYRAFWHGSEVHRVKVSSSRITLVNSLHIVWYLEQRSAHFLYRASRTHFF